MEKTNEALKEAQQKEGKMTGEPAIPPDPLPASPNFTGNYILMPKTSSTYALGLHALQEACIQENNQNQPQIVIPDNRKVYRANTFLENILARMNDWETLRDSNGNKRTPKDRKRYFNTWLNSSGGIVYQSNSTKLKLQLVCPQLMGIAKDFSKKFLPVDYNSFSGDATLDRSSPNFVRDGWLALLEGKTDVYANYFKMLKEIAEREINPKFWAYSKEHSKGDDLLAVYVNSFGYSGVVGSNFLNLSGRFLRRSP